ncbi:hypothetical protein [Krasilnikovia sp. MM14-A1004]|uniref:hypothetical protein n=1 Tax=Krasilnikovia sp. MM14-A1004 TaxID=3373541 RepID=UPI00399D0ACC
MADHTEAAVARLLTLARQVCAAGKVDPGAGRTLRRAVEDLDAHLRGRWPAPPTPATPVTVDEFLRVFAAQRPDADWVRAVGRFLAALDRQQVTGLLAALPRADRRTRVELVRILAPHLDREQTAEAAAIVARTDGAGARLVALGCLIDRLPEAQRRDAVAAAVRRAVKVPAEAHDLIALAAPYLSSAQLVTTLRAVAANQVPGAHYQTLRAAAAHLSPDGLDQALAFLPTIPEEAVRAFALAELAPLLPADRLGTASTLARDIRSGIHRARALAGLAPHLPPAERAAAVRDALHECMRAREPSLREIVVGMLAPLLDRRQHDTVLDRVAGGDTREIPLLRHCGPHLDAAHLDRALDLVRDRRFDYLGGGEGLLAVEPYLSPAQRYRAAADLLDRMVRTRGGLDHASAVALAALAGDLTADQIDTVVEAASLPSESHHRAWLIAAVLPCLTPAQAGRAAQQALGIADPAWRTPVLADLFPRLDADGRARVVASTATIDDPATRVAAIAGYLCHLPLAAQGTHLAEALDVAEAIEEPHERAIALAQLAASVPPPVREKPLRLAFTAALESAGRSRRIRALAAVGATLTGTRPDLPALRPAIPIGTSTFTTG